MHWYRNSAGLGTVVFALGIGPTVQVMLGAVKRVGLFRWITGDG